MEDFIAIAAFLLLGTLVNRFQWLPESAPLKLNQFVIYISLPAVILLRMPQLVLDEQVLLPMVMPWFLIGLSALTVHQLGKFYHWPRDVIGCLMMVVPLGNTSYLGFPMVKAFFGDEALPYAIIYDQIGNFIGLAVYGSIVIAHYSGDSDSTKPLALIKRIFTFPPFLALLTALALKGWSYPEGLIMTFNALATTMVPMTMFIVGLQLRLKVPMELKSPLKWALSLKLIAMPAVAALICLAFDSFEMAGKISIFESAMPPMVTAGILAIAANLSPRLAVATVGLGLLSSALTLPLLYLLLTM